MAEQADFDVGLFKSEIGRAAQVLQDSMPGAVVTLIIRFPGYEDGYCIAGQDDLDAIGDVVRRARLLGAQ